VKARGMVNDLSSLEQDLAVLDLGLFERIVGGKMPRGNVFIGQRPEVIIQGNRAVKRADEDLLKSARGNWHATRFDP
jgi:hypothetical protein